MAIPLPENHRMGKIPILIYRMRGLSYYNFTTQNEDTRMFCHAFVFPGDTLAQDDTRMDTIIQTYSPDGWDGDGMGATIWDYARLCVFFPALGCGMAIESRMRV